MLVLTRRQGEGIQIGPVLVRILRTGHGSIRIGIEAPRELIISRVDEPEGLPAPSQERRDGRVDSFGRP